MDSKSEKKSATIPLKTVNDIVNSALDGNVKCTKSFVKIMQMCGNAFIGQLAMELAVQADKDKCKTIGDAQVYSSLSNLGFEDMCKEVKNRMADPENQKKKRGSVKRKMLEISEISTTQNN